VSSSSPFDRQAPCPNCGAPLVFKFAAAKAIVCKHCKFLVARTDRNLAAVGRVADLAELPSPLALHATGMWNGQRFEVEGRVQLDRAGAPGAPWQEFFIGFPATGRWSWVAHAQGNWYATTEVTPTPPVPPLSSLQPGMPVVLANQQLVVQEVGRRRVVSAEGELPGVSVPGAVTAYADLSGPGHVFGTIDYGDGRAVPTKLFLGQRFDPATFKLDSGQPLEMPKAAAASCECPNCGGSLPLVAPGTTERIACRYCGTMSDVKPGGALEALGPTPRPPMNPYVPLGAEGMLRGKRVICIGFVIRGTNVEGVRYNWREYLLYAGPSEGYVWLMEEDNKWQLVAPLASGDVRIDGASALYAGAHYRFKQRVHASVDYVIGEFYWKVAVGESVTATEYQGGNGIVSVEQDHNEMNVSFCHPISGAEIAQAFGIQAPPPRPYVSEEASAQNWSRMITFLVIIIVLIFVFSDGCDGCGGSGVGGPGIYVGPGFGGK
jgi:hypothetical protein